MEIRKIWEKPIAKAKEIKISSEIINELEITIWNWTFHISDLRENAKDLSKSYEIRAYNQKYFYSNYIVLAWRYTTIEKAKEQIEFFLLSYKTTPESELKLPF